jgi:hypothetical protein
LEWGIPLDEWYAKPRQVRIYMIATMIAKNRVELAQVEERQQRV